MAILQPRIETKRRMASSFKSYLEGGVETYGNYLTTFVIASTSISGMPNFRGEIEIPGLEEEELETINSVASEPVIEDPSLQNKDGNEFYPPFFTKVSFKAKIDGSAELDYSLEEGYKTGKKPIILKAVKGKSIQDILFLKQSEIEIDDEIYYFYELVIKYRYLSSSYNILDTGYQRVFFIGELKVQF